MVTLSLPLILSTFGIIFLGELPDKTSLATLVLATKYRARDVVAGAWLAFVVQTIVAIVAGSFLTLLPAAQVRIVAGLGFLVFAYFAFTRKEEEEKSEEVEEVQEITTKKRRPVWLMSFLVVFAAEWGDITQLATGALVAQNGHPVSIGIGAVLALWSVTLIAVVAGAQLNRFLNPKLLNIISGALFAIVGIFIIVSALITL